MAQNLKTSYPVVREKRVYGQINDFCLLDKTEKYKVSVN
jgi:hypothetical protein